MRKPIDSPTTPASRNVSATSLLSTASPAGLSMLVSAAGNPIFSTCRTDRQRSTRLRNRNRTSMLRTLSRVTPATTSTTCERMVATAAPRTPIAGSPSSPKISSGSRMALSVVEIANSQVTVVLSPCELKPKITAKNTNTSTDPPVTMVKYSSASGRMSPVAPVRVSSGRRNASAMAVKNAAARMLSTNDCPRIRSASGRSRRPMQVAISTPEPTVIPMVSEIITNRVICDTVTAAMAASEIRLTQNASTNWYSVWKKIDSITGHASDQLRCRIEPPVRLRPRMVRKATTLAPPRLRPSADVEPRGAVRRVPPPSFVRPWRSRSGARRDVGPYRNRSSFPL